MAITMQYMRNPRMSGVKVLTKTTMTQQQSCSFIKLSTQTKTLFSKQSYCCVPSTQLTTYKACIAITSLAKRWREVQGLHDWENLIEPLDPLLQREIIRYGRFVAACYNAFDLNPNSRRYLSCKYGKKTVLEDVGMGDSGYEVTKYIYVTPDINFPMQNGTSRGRWVGYIAVSSDDEVKKLGRRDILVTFRGTVTHTEWIANLMSSLTPARLDPHNHRLDVKVETGFLSLYTSNECETRFGLGSCREQLLSELSRLLSKCRNDEISITIAGHSMGSSLALLLAYDLSELELNKLDLEKVIPITVFSFAGPRVGNLQFKERCEELGIKVLRVVNAKDPITKIPGVLFNENFRNIGWDYEVPWRRSCYVHVGVELVLDLFKMEHIFCVHDLETYINLLKCCKRSPEVERKGVDLCSKAKELMLKVRNVKISRWRDATMNMVMKVMPQGPRS